MLGWQYIKEPYMYLVITLIAVAAIASAIDLVGQSRSSTLRPSQMSREELVTRLDNRRAATVGPRDVAKVSERRMQSIGMHY